MTRTRTIALVLTIVALIAAGFVLTRRPSEAVSTPESELLKQASPTEVREEIGRVGAAVTVINFWASWCEPCKREFPHYLRLAREYRDRGVRVMFISVDDRSDFDEAASFLRENGVDFLTFYKGRQSLNFVAELYPKWTGAVPATVLFGPHAEILDTWEGDTTWSALEKKVSKQLATP